MSEKTWKCYKVTVETTNAVNDAAKNEETGKYIDVEDKCAFIVTDDPKKIYDLFGKSSVMKIEKVGLGYIL